MVKEVGGNGWRLGGTDGGGSWRGTGRGAAVDDPEAAVPRAELGRTTHSDELSYLNGCERSHQIKHGTRMR